MIEKIKNKIGRFIREQVAESLDYFFAKRDAKHLRRQDDLLELLICIEEGELSMQARKYLMKRNIHPERLQDALKERDND